MTLDCSKLRHAQYHFNKWTDFDKKNLQNNRWRGMLHACSAFI